MEQRHVVCNNPQVRVTLIGGEFRPEDEGFGRAHGLVEFGEDRQIDKLIRKYGYFGTPHTLKMVEENESVGFKYADFDEVTAKYNPETLKEGYNTLADGEEIYYISSPALGLWAHKDRFDY